MGTDSQIAMPLLTLYQHALYRVFAQPEFVLQVGQKSNELVALYQHYGLDSAIFITASNPRSVIWPADKNALANQALAQDIQQLGLPFYPALGEDPQGEWPAEDSFLVFGMTAQQGSLLSQRYQQNAVLFCRSEGLVELLLLR